MSSKEKFRTLTDEEWADRLDAGSFKVLRKSGTEPPWSSALNREIRNGIYACRGCGQRLYASESKFDSGCGWPSFDRAIDPEAVTEHLDESHGMVRVEMRCSQCEGHLGHVFPDGPTETGLRHCVNGIALEFQADDKAQEL